MEVGRAAVRITSDWTMPFLGVVMIQREGPQPWMMSILLCLN